MFYTTNKCIKLKLDPTVTICATKNLVNITLTNTLCSTCKHGDQVLGVQYDSFKNTDSVTILCYVDYYGAFSGRK